MLEKEKFFEKFAVEDAFEESELKWEILQEIYDDYESRRTEIDNVCQTFERSLKDNLQEVSFHSIRCRSKDPDHLVEKIIRKRGIEHNYKYANITAANYQEIIHDLIGVRILLFAKEDWEAVFDRMIKLFSDSESMLGCMAERPVAYTRYGDRDIFKDKIHAEHSNKGYRSQHYIVKFQHYYCEIQVRTLSEEVYGEFDHMVKYPYRDQNKFLIRYTNTLSQLLDAVDELISTCFQMQADGWENCNQYYEKDKYIDWKNISQKTQKVRESQTTVTDTETKEPVNMREFARNNLLRRR
nr:hypothetical protein [Ruminococcus sp. 1001713B170207_170306_F5]